MPGSATAHSAWSHKSLLMRKYIHSHSRHGGSMPGGMRRMPQDGGVWGVGQRGVSNSVIWSGVVFSRPGKEGKDHPGETGSAQAQKTSCWDTRLGGRSCLPLTLKITRSATLASSPQCTVQRMSQRICTRIIKHLNEPNIIKERQARTFPRLS